MSAVQHWVEWARWEGEQAAATHDLLWLAEHKARQEVYYVMALEALLS